MSKQRKSRDQLIHDAATIDRDGLLWRRRMERWMDRTYRLNLGLRVDRYTGDFGTIDVLPFRQFMGPTWNVTSLCKR